MTESEICGSYRQADNKSIQIRILSELTMKSEYEIMAIIVRNGYDLPRSVMKRLINRLDALESKIIPLEREYKEIYRAITGAQHVKRRQRAEGDPDE